MINKKWDQVLQKEMKKPYSTDLIQCVYLTNMQCIIWWLFRIPIKEHKR